MVWRNTRVIHQFLLVQKGLYILRNNSDSKDVDLYNTRKRYAVIESLMRNISWLASYFSKIKKPNKHCSGNQSVIAGVCIFDTIATSLRAVFHWFRWQWACRRNDPHTKNHRPLLEGCNQVWQHHLSHQVQKKMMEMATDLSVTNLSLTRGNHWARWLQRVFWTMVSIRLFQSRQIWLILLYGIPKGLFWKTANCFTGLSFLVPWGISVWIFNTYKLMWKMVRDLCG